MSKNLSRRKFLIQSAMSYGSLSLRALVTGLPAAFLTSLNNPAMAQDFDKKYVIMSHQQDGDPVNTNIPGTYPDDPNDVNDLRSRIDHPAGLASPVDFTLGNQAVRAAAPWAKLPADLRERFAFWHHPTFNNGHIDFDKVLGFNGALRSADGAGGTDIDTFLFDETYDALQSISKLPISIGGSGITYRGAKVPVIEPDDLQALFAANISDLEQMIIKRDEFIDNVYSELKETGTPAQRTFLDNYAISRESARDIGNNLVDLLDGSGDPAKIAVAMIQLNVSPLVTVGLDFGGDNHLDSSLVGETDSTTTQGIAFINTLWTELKRANLQDSVVFSSLNVFGRTFFRNSKGGRDHNARHHAMATFGPTIKGGIIGGIEPHYRRGELEDFKATGINSQTGGSENPDIPYEETFVSVGKTLAKAAGISDDIINQRFDGGRIIPAALS